MPAGTEDLTRASVFRRHAAKLSRNKAVYAQQKNNLEEAKLLVYRVMVDRKKINTTVCAKLEQEEIRKDMRRMRKTTGFCRQRLAPNGPSDKEHEHSPYFQTASKVSEKRLQKWKCEEDALQRILLSEGELRPPWEKGKQEVAKETLHRLLEVLGYDDVEAEVMMKHVKDQEVNGVDEAIHKEPCSATCGRTIKAGDACQRRASTSSSRAMALPLDPFKRIDVFECLKCGLEEPGTNVPDSGRSDDNNNDDLQSRKPVSPSAAQITPRVEFSVHDWERRMTEAYENKLINAMRNGKRIGGDNRSFRTRPQSAPVKTQASLVMTRQTTQFKQHPKGAWDGVGDKSTLCGVTSIKDTRPDGVKENADLTDLPNPKVKVASGRGHASRSHTYPRPVTALPPRAMQATRSMMVAKAQPRTSYIKASSPPQSTVHDTHTTPNQTSPDDIEQCHLRSVEHSMTVPEPPVCVACDPQPGSDPGSDLCKMDRLVGMSSQQAPKARIQLPVRYRKSAFKSVGDADLINSDPDDTSVRNPPIRGSDNLRHHRQHAIPVINDLSKDEGSDEKPEVHVNGESSLRAQWRRRILREAPPGGRSRNEKVRLAVSKSVLRHDMEKMIVDHEVNIKHKVREEHIRRLRKRMSIVMALQKLAKNPEPDPTNPDRNEQQLGTRVRAITEIMRLKADIH